MINIKELTTKDIGRWVRYKTKHTNQTGKIKSYNDENIFIVYSCGADWDNYKNYTGASTNPKDVSFLDITNKKCECPEVGKQGVSDDWYDTIKELPFVDHKPNECKCVNELKLYEREGKSITLCSCCNLSTDKPI